jgi:methylenetetrahydrofolate reductase (NADPH)
MRFAEVYSQPEKILSFEFFPPKQAEGLEETKFQIRRLARCKPHFMTVTYGAGGGTREFTRRLVSFIHNELGQPAAAHLTCVGHSSSEIDAVLNGLAEEGINAVVALRGDPPEREKPFEKHPQGFVNALELTAHIKKHGGFSIAVAGYPEGHPEASSLEADIDYLKRKVDAGAEVVITQLFFDPEYYFRFRDKAVKRGIKVPLVPGIMPIGSISQIRRFTTMCGATIPGALQNALAVYEQDSSGLIHFGIDCAVKLCAELLAQGAPGLHLYTLNRSVQAQPIVESLKLGVYAQ